MNHRRTKYPLYLASAVLLSSLAASLAWPAGALAQGAPGFSACRSLEFLLDDDGVPIVPGQILDTEYADLGVTFSGFACNTSYDLATGDCEGGPSHRRFDRLMVFDSAAPTGGDEDLGAPNDTCDDGQYNGTLPGKGVGGELGQPGQNCEARGHVLILSEDGDANDPDDNNWGGQMEITLDLPARIEAIGLLDAEEPASFRLTSFDAFGNVLSVADSGCGAGQPCGDNSFQTLPIQRSGVSRFRVELPGSGGVTGFNVCFQPGAIGDRVWLDEDSDGYQDEGEAGLPNVPVELWIDSDGDGARDVLVATTVTDLFGGYRFTGLPPARYFVDIDESNLPPNLLQTPPATLPGADLGNQDHSGDGYAVVIAPASENLTADFGYNWNPGSDVNDPPPGAPGAIGDRVWSDADGDGFQDAGEVGIAGIPVSLWSDPDLDGIYDHLVAGTTTDLGGLYLFDDLAPAAYVVTVDRAGTAIAAWTQTGDPDEFGVPATAPDDRREPLVLAPGDVFVHVDFGYQPPTGTAGSIGDLTWLDADASGTPVPDAGEPGLSGVSVSLVVDVDRDGVWTPAGADGAFGTADDEPIVGSILTDATGTYLFPGLPVDDGSGSIAYLAVVTDTAGILDGLEGTYDADGVATPRTSATTLSPSFRDDAAQDFSFTPEGGTPGSALLGDTVFFDLDGNGAQDHGELGIPGVRVLLLDASGTVVGVRVTDRNGRYLFGGLAGGSYEVRIVTDSLAAGLTNTADPDGGFDSISAVNLPAGSANLDQDFGYRPAGSPGPGTIGNLVWNDTDADGVDAGPAGPDGVPGTDDDEFRLAGVTLDLYRDLDGDGAIGPADPRIATTTTAADGSYLFDGLVVDDGSGSAAYVVDVTDDAGILAERWHSLGDGSVGADGNSKTDPYAVVLTSASPDVLTADFGYYERLAALGNRTWHDVDGNGLQDPGEPGLGGVRVRLDITYPNGDVVPVATVSSSAGRYYFDSLADEDHNGDGAGPEPTYVLSASTPVGFMPTAVDVGSDDLVDSDDHDGVAATTVQGRANTNLATNPADEDVIASYDFGFVALLERGDLPAPYPTLEAADGARHQLVGPRLGAAADAENDGFPSLAADGDDLDGLDDEDGVQFETPLHPGRNARIRVTTSGAGFLNAFFDFNGNGSLTDAGEQVYVDEPLAAGANLLTFAVPAGGTPVLYARFRYSSTPGAATSPTGLAADGEVEDYALGSIGDFVWDDSVNGNGVQEAGELGLPNVSVHLLTAAGSPVLDADGLAITTTTDASGGYRFGGLTAAGYRVEFSPPAGAAFSPADQGGDDGLDSDADPTTGRSPVVTLGTGAVDDTVDAGIRSPTVALVSSAVAYRTPRGVVFQWRTASEAQTLGYFVDRYDPATKGWQPVSETLVPAEPGAVQGATYRLLDAGAPNDGTVVYSIAELEADGNLRMHGPFRVRVREQGKRPEVDGDGHSAARRQRDGEARRATASEARAKTPPTGGGGYAATHGKVRVDRRGIQFVPAADIARVLGLSMREVGSWLSQGRVALRRGDDWVAYAVGDSPSGLYFFGEPVDTVHTGHGVYWIEDGWGPRMVTESGGFPVPSAGGSFPSTVHFEQEVFAGTNATTERDVDYWFWSALVAGHSTAGIKSFSLDLEDVDLSGGSASLRIALMGASRGAPGNDHRAVVRINGVEIGSTAWSDHERHAATFEFDAGLLATGANTMELEAVLEPGVAQSIFYLDEVDVTYPRFRRAVDDRLTVSAAGDDVLSVDGFSTDDIRVYRVDDPVAPVEVVDLTVDVATGYRVSFEAASAEARYEVVAAPLAPAAIDARLFEDARGDLRAEYLVIAPAELAQAAADLVRHRDSGGLSAAVVQLEAIYDTFSEGVETPWAIRDFLEHAWSEWGNAPRYAVLAGAGTFDHRDRQGAGDSLIPPVLAPTPFGLAAADNLLADFDEDGIPEIAIGRIPALSNEELASYVDKLVAFESDHGSWRSEAILLADDPDMAGDFTTQSRRVGAHLPATMTVDAIELEQMSTPAARAAVASEWGAGAAFVNYVGHGGVDQMAAEGLLRGADVPALGNGSRLPVVSALTCVVSRYEVPGFDSLGEKLVMEPNGGAIAVWAPTGLSLSGSAVALGEMYTDALFSTPGATVGEAVVEALSGFAAVAGADFMAQVYTILGDPAVSAAP